MVIGHRIAATTASTLLQDSRPWKFTSMEVVKVKGDSHGIWFLPAAGSPIRLVVTLRLPVDLATPLTYVKGVGPGRAAMLEAKGLLTVEDLLAYLPFRYEDRSNLKPIAELAPGEMATVIAEVRSAKMSGFKRRNLGLFEATFTDGSGHTLNGKWFHGGYLQNVLVQACAWPCSGKSSSIPTRAICR